jgi:HSP20 family protein
MDTLVKRNGFNPLVSTGFLPTTNTFFDDFLSRDLMEMTVQNFATLGTNLPSVNLKKTDQS